MSKEIVSKTKTFTIPLIRFLRYHIKSNEKMPIDLIDAQMIAEIDKDNEFCHVQFETFSGEVLPLPLVWYIKEWKSSYLKYQLDKERSIKERKELNLLTENRDLALKALAAELGLSEIDDIKLLQKVALKIAKVKKDSVASKTLGITIDTGE